MNAAERLADQLKVGGKIQGFRKAVYKPDGSLDHYMRQMLEVEPADILEVCKAASNQEDPIVQSQTKGCSNLDPGLMVVLYADDVFHLLSLNP